MLEFWLVCSLLVVTCLRVAVSPPIIRDQASLLKVKRPEFLPPDHVAGRHEEHDGHVNKEYHHEAFLGTLIKEGKLKFDNMEGYKILIDIFHKLDTDGNHRADEDELRTWIHDRINEHFNAARDSAIQLFDDIDKNDTYALMPWKIYKSALMDDPSIAEDKSTNITTEMGTLFENLADSWSRADYDGDGFLNRHEFVAFIHPETNRAQVDAQAARALQDMDRDKDGKISVDEFAWLPPGEVDDPEEQEMDRQFLEDKKREFNEDLDIDSDGFASIDELTIYFDSRHMQHAIKEAQYLIRVSDRDRDNRISEHEMLMNYQMFTGSSFSRYGQYIRDQEL